MIIPSILLIISLPGIWVLSNSSYEVILKFLKSRGEEKIPSKKTLIFAQFMQNSLLVLLASFGGMYFINQTGVSIPLVAAIESNQVLEVIVHQVSLGFVFGVIGFIIFATTFVLGFRRFVGDEIANKIIKERSKLSLIVRILYGGIVEEVMFRWGVQSLFLWVLFSLLKVPILVASSWAIVIASILFSLGHLPSVSAQIGGLTTRVVISTIFYNFVLSVIFGLLFFHVGLLSSIIAHITLHLFMSPMDVELAKRI